MIQIHKAVLRPTIVQRFRRGTRPRSDHQIDRVGVVHWTLLYVIVAAKREWEVWRRGRRRIMEMHCIPQDEVADLVREGGGALVDAEKHVMDGGFQSRRYWVISRS